MNGIELKSYYTWNVFILIVLSFSLMTCRAPEGPAGLSGTNGEGYDALLDPEIQPRVIFSYPSDQSQGPYDSYNFLQIRFNKIMNLESFKKGVTFSSADGNIYLDTNNITSNGKDIISVRPITSDGLSFYWKVGQYYSLTVSTEVTDINGNHPREPYTISFLPEPYFRVISCSPANMTSNLSLVPKLRLDFNSLIDSSILSSISISPSIQTRWLISSNKKTIGSAKDTIRFNVDTKYTITLPATAHDMFGNRLGKEFSISFTTTPFRISAASIQNGAIEIYKLQQISFTLTGPIDTTSINSGISILPTINYNSIGINSKDRYRIYCNFLSRLQSSTKYTIHFTSSIKSKSGKSLVPFTLEFTTASTP